MYLSQTSEYALRAMAHLATLEDDEPIRAAELSEVTSIPVHYLSKVMRRMVLAGLVSSQKGHGGGFVLARAPKKIRLADVLAAAGLERESNHCAFGWGRCGGAFVCPLHEASKELNKRLGDWADQTTLADVSHPTRRRLKVAKAR